MNYSQHKEQRVGVFVDVQNMYYSAKNLYQAKVNFNKVLETGISGRKLVRAFAYVIKADVGAEKEFFGALSKIGFEVKEKDLQVFYGGAKKGDWDVGLCMDVVRLLPKVDTVVIVSGDGDYYDLLEYAKSQGVKTEVIAFGETASNKLTETADLFVNMSDSADKFLIKDKKIKFLDRIPVKEANKKENNRPNKLAQKEQRNPNQHVNGQRNSPPKENQNPTENNQG